MRIFDYRSVARQLAGPAVAAAVTRVHEDKGKLEMLEQLAPQQLAAFCQRAHRETAEASLRIEGVYLNDARVEELLAGEEPQTDEEQQLVGYAHMLETVERDYGQLELSTSTIISMYETVYACRDFGMRSRYRKKDYVYTQMDGHMQAVPVSPITAFETPLVLGGACDGLAGAFEEQASNPLVLTAAFTVDFLCIRPFDEGNGRIARLFADLMLRKSGFDISRYQSVDKLIEEDGNAYYDALNACVEGWDKGKGDYTPYVLYWLDVIHRAHERLFERCAVAAGGGAGKAQRVRQVVQAAPNPITKRQILETCPDISVSTVENVLGELVRTGAVRKLGAGRSTAYVFVG